MKLQLGLTLACTAVGFVVSVSIASGVEVVSILKLELGLQLGLGLQFGLLVSAAAVTCTVSKGSASADAPILGDVLQLGLELHLGLAVAATLCDTEALGLQFGLTVAEVMLGEGVELGEPICDAVDGTLVEALGMTLSLALDVGVGDISDIEISASSDMTASTDITASASSVADTCLTEFSR